MESRLLVTPKLLLYNRPSIVTNMVSRGLLAAPTLQRLSTANYKVIYERTS